MTELKKLVRKAGEHALVEPGSQAEADLKAAGFEEPGAKKVPAKKAPAKKKAAKKE